MFTGKFHPHRMGLVDFWYYENQEFEFESGHLLLRGSNGSGKSVTMQSFIPLLLDGNKNSERLDAFGTRSRKIENYLLDEDEQRNDRIGYLWMEFKREDEDIYKTIGIGLHARANKKTEAWYFVLIDNRRINYDFSLLRNHLALTQQELKNLIGPESVLTSRSEYMQRVNQELFGFESQDQYKELISLLVQLRSPKLSNSLKPGILNEMLQDSLRPLSEDELRPMSEAIASMDRQKDELDMLKQAEKAAGQVYHIYKQYNRAVLYDKLKKAQAHRDRKSELEIQKKQQANQSQILAETRQQKEQIMIDKQALQSSLQEERNSIKDSDALRMIEQLHQTKMTLKNLEEENIRKEETKQRKDNRYQDVRRQLREYQDRYESEKRKQEEALSDLEGIQENLQFEDHPLLIQELKQELMPDFDAAEKLIKSRQLLLKEGLKEIEHRRQVQAQAMQQTNTIQRLQDEDQRLQSEQEQAENQYDEIIEEMKSRFYHWSEKNTYLKLDEKQFQKLTVSLLEYEEKRHYYTIQQQVSDLWQAKWAMLADAMNKAKVTEEQLRSKNEALSEQIRQFQQQKNLDLLLEDAVLAHRKELKKQEIAYCPLYEKLEFDNHCSESMRQKIEAVLKQSGLLDCILIERKDWERVNKEQQGYAQKMLVTDIPLLQIPAFYLREEFLSHSLIRDFEQHFHVSLSALQLDLQGYRWGSLQGWTTEEIPHYLIGQTSREQYRLQQIEVYQNELKLCEQKQQHIYTEINELRQAQRQLDLEYKEMPKEDDLNAALTSIETIVNHRKQLQKMMEEAKKRWSSIKEKLNTIDDHLRDLADQLHIACDERFFELRKEAYDQYYEQLQLMKSILERLQNIQELCTSASNEKENLEHDLDELNAEISQLMGAISARRKQIEQLQKQIEDAHADQLERRLREILEQLEVLPKQILQLNGEIGELKQLQKQNYEEAEKLKNDLFQQTEVSQRYDQVVDKELKEAYLEDEIKADASWKAMMRYLEQTESFGRKAGDLQTELQTQFLNQRIVLQDYSPSYRLVLEEEDLEDIAGRLELSARVPGKKISFQELVKTIEKNIETEELLIQDKERELFEDIMINTISKTIRRHIHTSREWVNQMNTTMSAMNSSSALKFSLQWKGRKAQSDQELDSRQLIELLERDAQILKPIDHEKLSKHFRSRLFLARKEAEKEENQKSFHQIMQQVMDYRKWFEFTILYQKGNEKKKELTNSAFYSFSGGEKAMAMYIPLFSAVSAKYSMARQDAPRIIALDEAFAGVDENNIDIMFGLTEEFEFDYIMNSQILWGDYPTVKQLRIAELYRPEGVHYVTVVNYSWNGKIRRIIT